ncbi:MAG: MGMT family protein [Candidatus Omnitrophota bacterium]
MKRPRGRLYDILKANGFTPFEIRVYKTVSSIPWGTVKTYKWVAYKIKNPRSFRAVGQALNKNPFPLVIPCHRVIREDGGIGGFAYGGSKLKKKLLEYEKVGIIKTTDD